MKIWRHLASVYSEENMAEMNSSGKKYQVSAMVNLKSNLVENMENKLKNTKKNATNTAYNNYVDVAKFQRELDTISKEDLLPLFDLACEIDLPKHVEKLLEAGVDPNATIGNRKHSILETAYKGYHEVLDVLKATTKSGHEFPADFKVENKKTKCTVLHYILQKDWDDSTALDYEKCIDILFDEDHDISKQMKMIINKKDRFGNTALHYATQKWPQKYIRKLLEFGANIGIKNNWEDIPISLIRPETMEEFLDDHCISYNDKTVHDKDFTLEFRYDFLAPDKENLPEKYRIGDEEEQTLLKNGSDPPTHALPETEPLWYMGQSKEHRRLLKHPVITSFLWYKWKRIRGCFNRNLRFYFLFVFILTWYIFENFGGGDKMKTNWVGHLLFILLFMVMLLFVLRDWLFYYRDRGRGNKTEGICSLTVSIVWDIVFIAFMAMIIGVVDPSKEENGILKISLIILLSILGLRELLQLFMSLKRYFTSPENWLEVAMIGLIAKMIYNEGINFEENRHLAAIAILFSYAELVTFVCKHPKLNKYNIYITMFYKVLKDFVRFFSWYCVFIIAFGFGFYIILHEDPRSEVKPPEDEHGFFNKTWLSLVKTSTMFVGELEFGDLPFNQNSPFLPLTYIFFLCFVFLIVVVLMNLLNGLAVGETGDIREKAEIYSYLSQVETISYIESMMLGDPFDFLRNLPLCLSWLPSFSLIRLFYRISAVRSIIAGVFGPDILLFHNYFSGTRKIIKPNETLGDCCCNCFAQSTMVQKYCCCLSVDEMGRDIVSAAKEIVVRRSQEEPEDQKETVFTRLDLLEQQLADIKQILLKMEAGEGAKGLKFSLEH